MSSQEQIKHLLAHYTRHLYKLQEQQAKFGPLNTPAHLLIEIEDTERKIEQLQETLMLLETSAGEDKIFLRDHSPGRPPPLRLGGGLAWLLFLGLAICAVSLYLLSRGDGGPLPLTAILAALQATQTPAPPETASSSPPATLVEQTAGSGELSGTGGQSSGASAQPAPLATPAPPPGSLNQAGDPSAKPPPPLMPDPLAVAQAQVDEARNRYKYQDFSGALNLLDQAIAVMPNNPEALYLRGQTRKELGDLVGAMADFEQVTVVAAGSDWAVKATEQLQHLAGL